MKNTRTSNRRRRPSGAPIDVVNSELHLLSGVEVDLTSIKSPLNTALGGGSDGSPFCLRPQVLHAAPISEGVVLAPRADAPKVKEWKAKGRWRDIGHAVVVINAAAPYANVSIYTDKKGSDVPASVLRALSYMRTLKFDTSFGICLKISQDVFEPNAVKTKVTSMLGQVLQYGPTEDELVEHLSPALIAYVLTLFDLRHLEMVSVDINLKSK